MEEWKKVNEYPNFSVSNKGRVRNNLTGNILKPRKDRAGYEYVAYSRVEGKQKSLSVHRLVAIAFIPNPLNKSTVNHINGVHNDNRVENLEWATPREQNLHRYHTLGLYMSERGKQSLSSKRKKKVKRIEDGKIYNSITEASKECGVVISSISLCLTGRYKTAGGYHWKYI